MLKIPKTTKNNGQPFTRNPILKGGLSRGRSSFVLFLLFSAFSVLIGRALYLQTVHRDFLLKQGESRYARTIPLTATRGKILDREGQVLATSLPVKAIWAIPEDVTATPRATIEKLASLLEIPYPELVKKLSVDKTFVYLKRQVEPKNAQEIMALRIPGVETKKEYKRYYPQGETFAHIVGFTNVEDKGQEGIELIDQKSLAGINGSRRVIKDRLGRIVEDIADVKDPLDGHDVRLSIDSNIQYIVHTQLKAAVEKFQAKAAGAVVLDAQTGEVLALANLPTYNPNDRRNMTGAQLRNRVLTDTFEPGSIMKPFAVSIALDNKIVKPATPIDTAPGKMRIGSAVIGDAHPHGVLTVAQVIQKSSNVGTAKIALQLPPKTMWEGYAAAGFGQAPKIGFPGAVAGRMRPYKSWKPIEQATMSYGHGISVSLMQIAQAYLVFARQGDMIPVSMRKVTEPPVGKQVFSAETARVMREMLETVVSKEGTAPQAAVPGYRVGGKTGTAHKIVGGRYVNKYVSSFVGVAPISNPRVVIAVMVDEPTVGGHYGGTISGPVFSAVAGSVMRSLNIAPDAPIDVVAPQAPPTTTSNDDVPPILGDAEQ